MNWKVVLLLSLIDVGMVVGFVLVLLTVSFIPSTVELLFWLGIFVFNAFVITGRVPKSNYFSHAWMVNVVSGLWIGILYWSFHDPLMMNQPKEATIDTLAWMENPLVMLVLCPVSGALFGILSGFISMLVGKLHRSPLPHAA